MRRQDDCWGRLACADKDMCAGPTSGAAQDMCAGSTGWCFARQGNCSVVVLACALTGMRIADTLAGASVCTCWRPSHTHLQAPILELVNLFDCCAHANGWQAADARLHQCWRGGAACQDVTKAGLRGAAGLQGPEQLQVARLKHCKCTITLSRFVVCWSCAGAGQAGTDRGCRVQAGTLHIQGQARPVKAHTHTHEDS